MFLKVIACEIAFREICHVAARSSNVADLEFLTQGYHDTPAKGRQELQARINAVPAGRYEAVLLGYGLCSNILTGLTATHTPLVIPRAHDCITFFLGSKERYQEIFNSRPGTYYYTSGWLECRQRRGEGVSPWGAASLGPQTGGAMVPDYQRWVEKYGEERARYLLEVMNEWTAHYTHGVLIDFPFARHLHLGEQVQQICTQRGWKFEQIQGDLTLLQNWVDGKWASQDFLVVRPGEKVVATTDAGVIGAGG